MPRYPPLTAEEDDSRERCTGHTIYLLGYIVSVGSEMCIRDRTDSGESVMSIGENTGQLTDSGESVIRIGGNTGQLTDSGESVMRIGGNTGQLTDSGESVMRIGGNTGQLTDSDESCLLYTSPSPRD